MAGRAGVWDVKRDYDDGKDGVGVRGPDVQVFSTRVTSKTPVGHPTQGLDQNPCFLFDTRLSTTFIPIMQLNFKSSINDMPCSLEGSNSQLRPV